MSPNLRRRGRRGGVDFPAQPAKKKAAPADYYRNTVRLILWLVLILLGFAGLLDYESYDPEIGLGSIRVKWPLLIVSLLLLYPVWLRSRVFSGLMRVRMS
jgi:hypothetical protein